MLEIETWLETASTNRANPSRPLVSLCYAQSLDGSLTIRRGLKTPLSGPQSSRLTHQLRSLHDAILVGVGTLLSDDPLLSARLPGVPNPQPVILDSHLRTPPTARVLDENPLPAWIACLEPIDPHRKAILENAGAHLLPLPAGISGRVHLPALLDCLGDLGIRRLMVEGGAGVITAFLTQRLVDLLILTVTPVLLGGLPAVEAPLAQPGDVPSQFLRLRQAVFEQMGEDWVIYGAF